MPYCMRTFYLPAKGLYLSGDCYCLSATYVVVCVAANYKFCNYFQQFLSIYTCVFGRFRVLAKRRFFFQNDFWAAFFLFHSAQRLVYDAKSWDKYYRQVP